MLRQKQDKMTFSEFRVWSFGFKGLRFKSLMVANEKVFMRYNSAIFPAPIFTLILGGEKKGQRWCNKKFR